MSECKAALNIKGEHFPCDWPTGENGRHDGWAHSNRDAQAIWCSPLDPVPGMAGALDDRLDGREEDAVRDALNMAAAWGQLGALRIMRDVMSEEAWRALAGPTTDGASERAAFAAGWFANMAARGEYPIERRTVVQEAYEKSRECLDCGGTGVDAEDAVWKCLTCEGLGRIATEGASE